MAEHRSQPQRPLLTQEELKKKFEISNFDLNAILRGAQLTVVGGTHSIQARKRQHPIIADHYFKLFERYRTRVSSHQSTINKQP
jgi:hypothetical protein